jgi:DinB superfamily
MTKTEIVKHLKMEHDCFSKNLEGLSEAEFEFCWQRKWSAGQQLHHIIRSVQPVRWGMILPKMFFRVYFGKANRPSKSFEALNEKYQQKLALGGMATGRFLPQKISCLQRDALISELNLMVDKLCKLVLKYSEEDLDTLVVPHPLLGKITLREMLYFTVFHVKHHQNLVMLYLKQIPIN